MPQIIGKILDSAGEAISCELEVKLNDLLVFTAASVNQLRVPYAHIFNVPQGDLSIELTESATQRATYSFHLYLPQPSTLYYKLDGSPYTGPTHEENGISYTGSAPSSGRQQLFKEVLDGQETLTRFDAIVPIATTVQFANLVGQSIVSRRYVDRGYYREILASLPGTGESINDNIYPTRAEISALSSSLLGLQNRITALETVGGSGDITKPLLTLVTINSAAPARIVLQYSKALNVNFAPAPAAYSVPTKTVTAVSISGSQVRVDLSSGFSPGGSGSISYTQPASNPIQDAAGNKADTFSAYPFTATVDAPPVLSPISSQSRSADGSLFSLTPTNTGGTSGVTFSATGLPSGFSISSSTGQITGVLSSAVTATIAVTATNSGGASTQSFTLTVSVAPAGTLVAYPTEISNGWSTLGIAIYKDAGGNYFSNAVPDSYQTTSGTVAYSSPTALSTGAGTQADPRRLTELLATSSVGVIYLEPGEYNEKWASPASRNLSVVCPNGKAYINRFDLGVTWAGQGNNVWLAQGQTAACGMVQDFSVLDSYGNPKKMELRLSQAEVQANANSFFLGSSGNAVYVRTFDDRPPDSNIRLTKTGANGQATVNNVTMYFKNLVFNSGTDAFLVSGNASGKVIFNACIFRFGQGNSLSTVNATQHYLFGCKAFYSRKDGFNYHVNSGVGRTYEENCEARFNGDWINELNAPKNNGSTIHDGGIAVRVNVISRQNKNRNFHDVSPQTLSYNVGCVAGQSLTPVTDDASASFSFGLFDEVSTGAKAWYVGCVSVGEVKHDLQVHPGTTVTLISTTFNSILNQGTLIGAADTTPPALSGVSILASAPGRIILQYSEPLSVADVPSITAFSVPSKSISAVSISGAQAFVDVTVPIAAGESGTITYTAPANNSFRDAAGNIASSFSAQSFSLPITDTQPPVLSGVSVSSNNLSRIILQYGEALKASTVPATSAFTVPSKTVSAVSISGAQVFVDLAAPYAGGETSSISYAAPGSNPLQDAAGNISSSFSAQSFAVPIAGTVTTDFRAAGLTALPAGWTGREIVPTFNTTTGVTLTRSPTTPEQDGRCNMTGPIWTQERPLIFTYYGHTLRGAVGVTADAFNWVARANNAAGSSTPDTAGAGRTGIFKGGDNPLANGFTLATTDLVRTTITKESSDIRVVVEKNTGGGYVLAGQALLTGAAATLANRYIFVDSKGTDMKVQKIEY